MSEDTETFAFQAEINQLLSLIINVRLDADANDGARAARDRGVATRIAMARRGTTAASNASTRSRRERTTDEEIVGSKRSQTFYSNKEIFLRELIRCVARTATRFARDGDRRIAMRWRRLTLRDDDARGRARAGRARARDA